VGCPVCGQNDEGIKATITVQIKAVELRASLRWRIVFTMLINGIKEQDETSTIV
jgi:hypothetical protein